MKHLINFLIIMLLMSIKAKAQKVLADTSFMQSYCACNYEKIDGHFDKGKTTTRTTVNKNTLVYTFPNLQAKQTDTLEHFTNVIYLKEGEDKNTGTNWIKIKYKWQDNQGIYHDKEGYIVAQNISIGMVSSKTETENLDFILSESPLLDTDLNLPKFRLNIVNRFADLNYQKVKSVSTYDLNIGAVNYFNSFYLSNVYNNALKNMPNLLRLYWHHGESCPESDGHVFMAYTNDKMSEIISSSSTGEGVFYESTKVYIPLKFSKGKILLVENGDSENMFDNYNGNLRTIAYPKDCGIPIEQLIVVVEEDAAAKMDAKGNYILSNDKENVMEITHKVIKYYRWDGKKIQEVKKTVIKKRKEN